MIWLIDIKISLHYVKWGVLNPLIRIADWTRVRQIIWQLCISWVTPVNFLIGSQIRDELMQRIRDEEM